MFSNQSLLDIKTCSSTAANIVTAVDLYPHQTRSIQQLFELRRRGEMRTMLYAPTGAGKTEMAIKLIDLLLKKGKRVWFLVDLLTLVKQTSHRFTRYGIKHGIIQGSNAHNELFDPYQACQICSVQTLEARHWLKDPPDVLIVDEAHNLRKAVMRFIQEYPDMAVIGLSATPFTAGLGKIYSSVVNGATMKELEEQGRLVPLRVFIGRQIDMSNAKLNHFGEYADDDVAERSIVITGDVVTEWVSKTRDHFGGPAKTIVFSANVKHGKNLEAAFQKAGFNFRCVSYKETGEIRDDVLDEFRKPDSSIIGLIATDMLTKGFDVPDVLVGVSCRPFRKSFSAHIQQEGRTVRAFPGKTFALWLDHSGNHQLFYEDYAYLYEHGVTALDDGRISEKKTYERNKKLLDECTCPRCHAFILASSKECWSCQWQRPLPVDNVLVLPGELVAFDQRMAEYMHKRRFYLELLCYSQRKGYKNGWAYYEYRAKFGETPPRMKEVPVDLEISESTLKWIKYRHILYAKSKQQNKTEPMLL